MLYTYNTKQRGKPMTEEKKNLVIMELQFALTRIANHHDPVGNVTWKDLALQMAEVAREALNYLDKGENR